LCQQLLRDARFHRRLLEIDEDLAAQAKARRCSSCQGALHAASYPRKPRGVPEGLGADFERRHSFCCGAENCRKRLTPTSVRFLDRRVYSSVIVVLAAAMAHGLTSRRIRTLCTELDVDRRTLLRWQEWWREEVVRSDFFAELRGRMDRPLDGSRLPGSLFDRIQGADDAERLLCLLHLIDPLSHSALMRGRFARAA